MTGNYEVLNDPRIDSDGSAFYLILNYCAYAAVKLEKTDSSNCETDLDTIDTLAKTW